jgi:hypothetical protein
MKYFLTMDRLNSRFLQQLKSREEAAFLWRMNFIDDF